MNTPEAYLLIAAVVAGMIVQFAMSARQQRRFARDVADLRRRGDVAVGVGGKRYRGGRVYLVLCSDRGGMIRAALQLRGFSTLATARSFPPLIGRRLSEIAGPHDIADLDPIQRSAARQAADALRALRKDRKGAEPVALS